MWKEIKRIWACRELMLHLTVMDLHSANRDKLLGNLWALLDPLMMMIVLYNVFVHIRMRDYNFALYLFTGLLCWNFFTHIVTNAANCIHRQKGLIHKIPLPMGIFPLANLLRHSYDFAWGLVAFFVMKLFFRDGMPDLCALFLLPVYLIMLAIFSVGISFAIASIGVFLRDTTNILTFTMRLGFFLTPIFWEMSMIPERYHRIYFLLNPVAGYLVNFRAGLLAVGPDSHFDIPIDYYLGYLVLLAIVALVVGFSIFIRGQGHYAKYI